MLPVSHGEKLLKLALPPLRNSSIFRNWTSLTEGGIYPLPVFTWWTCFSRYQSYKCVSFLISVGRKVLRENSLKLGIYFFLAESSLSMETVSPLLYNRDDFCNINVYHGQPCLLIFVKFYPIQLNFHKFPFLFLFHSILQAFPSNEFNKFSHKVPLRGLYSTNKEQKRGWKKTVKKKRRIPSPCKSREPGYIFPSLKANNANLNKAVARLCQLSSILVDPFPGKGRLRGEGKLWQCERASERAKFFSSFGNGLETVSIGSTHVSNGTWIWKLIFAVYPPGQSRLDPGRSGTGRKRKFLFRKKRKKNKRK